MNQPQTNPAQGDLYQRWQRLAVASLVPYMPGHNQPDIKPNWSDRPQTGPAGRSVQPTLPKTP
jgi:hypothetical protein